MIYLLISISLFAIFQWWRKRVWKKRFEFAVSKHAPVIVNAFAEMWANAYRETQRNDWPEELER